MAVKAKYLMIASMDVDPERDTIFNEVYDKEHVPNLMKVPGARPRCLTRQEQGNIDDEHRAASAGPSRMPYRPVFTPRLFCGSNMPMY